MNVAKPKLFPKPAFRRIEPSKGFRYLQVVLMAFNGALKKEVRP